MDHVIYDKKKIKHDIHRKWKLTMIWGKVFLCKFQQEEEGEETQDEVSESQGAKDSKSRLQEKVRTRELSRIASVLSA